MYTTLGKAIKVYGHYYEEYVFLLSCIGLKSRMNNYLFTHRSAYSNWTEGSERERISVA